MNQPMSAGSNDEPSAPPRHMKPGHTHLSRRAFAGVLLGAALGGCAVAADEPVRAPAKDTLDVDMALQTIDPKNAPPAEPEAVTVPAAPPAPPVPSRDMIIAKYSQQKPAQWGLQLPGIQSRLDPGGTGPLLTFDCCGGPGGSALDQSLVDTLAKTGTPAIFFLNSRWIQANPGLSKSLADNPLFEIGNHGTRHVPLSVSGKSAYGITGTSTAAQVYDEVMGNQDTIFTVTGRKPRLFRPGTAYYDDVAVAIVRDLGLVPLGFSINGDAGATYPAATVTREVSAAKAGDVVICHANRPGAGTAPGVTRALADLRSRGIQPTRFAA